MDAEHSVVFLDSPRQLTAEEKRWMSKLLSVNFSGKEDLVEQVSHALVVGHCNCGKCKSIILHCHKVSPKFSSDQRVPVEMTLYDEDGVPRLFLLHVMDGYVSELEVVRADSDRLIDAPDCDNAVVTVNEDE